VIAETPAAFDGAAAEYDSVFTRTLAGRWLRARVWERLEEHFRPGMRVLELGCGTGEDALWLARRGVRVLATDASAAMLAIAREKAARAGLADFIVFRTLDLAQLPEVDEIGTGFDGVLSDFGALNCIGDRRVPAEWLGRAVRPGGRAVLVVMGPWCPWEVAWHAAHGQLGIAFRRWRRGGVDAVVAGRPVHVWYPSPGRLRRDLKPWWRLIGTHAVGALVPPPYLNGVVERRPRLFARLAALERRAGAHWPLNVLNDHYLIEFERSAR
jgi:SAM-dependent methyltransferase